MQYSYRLRTITGKTVNFSTKEDLQKYINSLKLDYTQYIVDRIRSQNWKNVT